jgi:hypothetical protein
LTRRSQPPYPWPPEQAQPGVSKPCRTTATTIAGTKGERKPSKLELDGARHQGELIAKIAAKLAA